MTDQPEQPTPPGQPDVNAPDVNAPESGPPEGWYADPHDSGQLRFWDGSTWTEYVHAQVPFAPPVPAPIAARYATGGDGSVNDIGEWLRSSFRVALSNIVPAVVLQLLPLAPFVVAAVMMFRVVGSLSETADEAFNDGLATTESFFTSDFDFTSLSLLVVAWVLGLLLLMFSQVGTAYLLHSDHIGQPVGLGRALATGFTRGWRLLGWYLALYLATALLLAAGVALVALAAAVVSEGLAVVLGALLYLAALILGVWIGVRLVVLPVACAVAPTGTSALSATLTATKGHFLAILGRVLLVTLLSYLVILPFQFVGFALVPNLVDFDSLAATDSELLTPGEVFGSLGTVFAVMAVLYAIVFSLYIIFYSSAIARLYADLGGIDSRL